MGVGKPIFNPKGMGDIRGVRFGMFRRTKGSPLDASLSMLTWDF